MSLDEAYVRDMNDKVDHYNWIKDVTENSYVDSKDTVNNWWVAKTLSVDAGKEELYLHFDGWSTKYDEAIMFLSSKLEPFRMITKGYTGMKNSTKRDEWKYTFHELDAIKRKIEDVIDSDFSNLKSAHDATQFLRGEVFFFVDCLLVNWDDEKNTNENYIEILDLMEWVFKMIIKWLDLFPTKFLKYYDIHK